MKITKKLSRHKWLIASIIINTILIVLLILNRQYFISKFFQYLADNLNKTYSYHLNAKLTSTDTVVNFSYVRDTSKYKQAKFNWSYDNAANSFVMIYNQDNFYFNFLSPQLESYMNSQIGNDQQVATILKPITTGETWLHLDQETLDSMASDKEYEQEILESKEIVASEIVKSLTLRGIPSLSLINRKPYLKLPLKLNYEKLNKILYPSLKSYIVPDQKLLTDILNQLKVDLYLDYKLVPVRIVVYSPQLATEKIDKLLGSSPGNIFGQLNEYLKSEWGRQESPYTLIIDYSEVREPSVIVPPEKSIKLQELMTQLFAISLSPQPAKVGKYVINNARKISSSGKDVDTNFYQISNMLYRYYNEHGQYPASLDPLANNYFPGMVPGNPQTAQGFYYQTFDNNLGYRLCPAADSLASYCIKRYRLDMIN